jgi:hypothetical protein
VTRPAVFGIDFDVLFLAWFVLPLPMALFANYAPAEGGVPSLTRPRARWVRALCVASCAAPLALMGFGFLWRHVGVPGTDEVPTWRYSVIYGIAFLQPVASIAAACLATPRQRPWLRVLGVGLAVQTLFALAAACFAISGVGL